MMMNSNSNNNNTNNNNDNNNQFISSDEPSKLASVIKASVSLVLGVIELNHIQTNDRIWRLMMINEHCALFCHFAPSFSRDWPPREWNSEFGCECAAVPSSKFECGHQWTAPWMDGAGGGRQELARIGENWRKWREWRESARIGAKRVSERTTPTIKTFDWKTVLSKRASRMNMNEMSFTHTLSDAFHRIVHHLVSFAIVSFAVRSSLTVRWLCVRWEFARWCNSRHVDRHCNHHIT